MTLRITLKPREQIYIGSARISVDSESQTRINIDGELPVVREKDYLAADKAITTARKLYLVLQRAYLNSDFDSLSDEYFRLVGMMISTQPAAHTYITAINGKLSEQKLYAALREARTLVQFDEGLLPSGEEAPQWEGF